MRAHTVEHFFRFDRSLRGDKSKQDFLKAWFYRYMRRLPGDIECLKQSRLRMSNEISFVADLDKEKIPSKFTPLQDILSAYNPPHVTYITRAYVFYGDLYGRLFKDSGIQPMNMTLVDSYVSSADFVYHSDSKAIIFCLSQEHSMLFDLIYSDYTLIKQKYNAMGLYV